MIRKARVKDAKKIRKLINFYAAKNELLPRSLNEIYDNIRDFFVCDHGGRIAGCCALHVSWEDLGELKSLVVIRAKQGKGIGRRLVKACMDEAGRLGLRRIFALTYQPDFFRMLGFRDIDKYSLPHKIWSECVRCIHFPDCKETALTKELKKR